MRQLFLLLTFTVLFGSALSQDLPTPGSAAIFVGGDLPKTGLLSLADLEALETETVNWTAADGDHAYRGVSLERLLAHFGFTPGPKTPDIPPKEKRRGWHKVVVASAPDGFQTVFSCAEVHAIAGAGKVYLVWETDGNPLPDNIGPFQLVVPTDHERSRCIYQVARFDVVDLQRIVAPLNPDDTN